MIELRNNIDKNKIQSNTKDIVVDESDNIVMRRLSTIEKFTTTVAPVHRTTLANIFSNSGGNGGNFDDVKILSADGGSTRKRHRNRRQKNVLSKNPKDNYEARLERLRHELLRSSETPPEKHIKPKQVKHHKKKITTTEQSIQGEIIAGILI